jgi:hypothetical protein
VATGRAPINLLQSGARGRRREPRGEHSACAGRGDREGVLAAVQRLDARGLDATRQLHVRRDVPVIEAPVGDQAADALFGKDDLAGAVHDRLPCQRQQPLVTLGRHVHGRGQDAARIPRWIAQPSIRIQNVHQRDQRAGGVPVAERSMVEPPRRQTGRVAAQTQQRGRCSLDLEDDVERQAHGAVEEQVHRQRRAAREGHHTHTVLERVARVPPDHASLVVVALHIRPDGLEVA